MANVQVVMTGDEARLFKSLAKVIKKEQEMATKFKDVGKAGKDAGRDLQRAGKQAEESFGAKAFANLSNVKSGLDLIRGAANSVTGAFREAAKARQEATQRASEAAPALGSLYSLGADVGPEAVANAKRIFSKGGAGTLSEAVAMESTIQQAGLPEIREIVTGLGRTGVVDSSELKQMIEAAAAIRAAFKNDDVGTTQEIFSKGLGMNELGAGTTPALLMAVADASAAADSLGMRDEEVMAAVSAISKVRGSATEAGTYASSFFTALAQLDEEEKKKLGMEGMTLGPGGANLEQILAALKGQELTFAETKGVLGRLEAVKGLDVLLKNPELVAGAMEDVEVAQRDDEITKRIAAAEADPNIRPFIIARQFENLRKMQDAEGAAVSALADAARDAKIAQAKDMATTPAERIGAGLAASGFKAVDATARMFLGDEAMLYMQTPSLRGELGKEAFREAARMEMESRKVNPNVQNAVLQNLPEDGGAMNVRDVPARDLRIPRGMVDRMREQARSPEFMPTPSATVGGDGSEALAMSLHRAAAAMELSARAQMESAAAGGGPRAAPRTPHRPSNRAAQLAERNAQRE